MNSKANNGYPQQQAYPPQYMGQVFQQIPAQAPIPPPPYNAIVGYPPFPPGVVPQPQYYNTQAAGGWNVTPSQQAQQQYAPNYVTPPPPPAYQAAQPMYQYPIHAQQPQYYSAQPQAFQVQTSTVAGVYDAGARFGKAGGSQSIPPPPPGIAPTQAQIAAMQGQPVLMTKKKNGFFAGGSGGGYTFW